MSALHVPTPVIESVPLSAISGTEVYLKLETAQPVGSFKIRGIGHACTQSSNDGAKALVASSGGNAGLAVAYAGRKLKVPVTIVVPSTTPPMMQDRLRAEGAEVIQHGTAWDDAHEMALELTKSQNAAYIHPFDDPAVWAGHATLVHELKETGPEPDLIITVVGGGGLLCGVLQGLHDVEWHHIPVMTLETEGAASYYKSVEANKRITLDRIDSIATTLGAKTVCQKSLDWTASHQILPRTVTDQDAVSAIMAFANDHRMLVEPSCGAALAAIYQKKVPSQFRKILVIVCGGAGVTIELINQWKEKLG